MKETLEYKTYRISNNIPLQFILLKFSKILQSIGHLATNRHT